MRPFGKRLGRVVEWASVVYSAGVVAATLLFWRVGESWWVTTVGLYLPRFVFAVPAPLFATALVLARSPRSLRSRWGTAAQVITLGVALVPMMGLSVPAPAMPFGRDRAAPHLRLLSYNINSAQGGVANLLAEVDTYSPDVVFMQEIGDTAELTRAMQDRYPTVFTSGQFLTASRYRLLSESDPEKVAYAGRPHRARYVVLTMQTPLGNIAFYNVHPVSPREELYRLRGRGLRREILSGHIFSGDAAQPIEDNAGLREAQVESFVDAASHESIPTVIAGDTNLPGLSIIVRRHLSQLQEGFPKAGWGFGYTFPTNHFPWMRIDRVFASDDFRFTSFRVGTSKASDHLCVVADLVRK